MKLIFKKDDNLNVTVFRKKGKTETEFSYVEMIKELIKTGKLDRPSTVGDFTDAEKESIQSMTEFINRELEALDEDWW